MHDSLTLHHEHARVCDRSYGNCSCSLRAHTLHACTCRVHVGRTEATAQVRPESGNQRVLRPGRQPGSPTATRCPGRRRHDSLAEQRVDPHLQRDEARKCRRADREPTQRQSRKRDIRRGQAQVRPGPRSQTRHNCRQAGRSARGAQRQTQRRSPCGCQCNARPRGPPPRVAPTRNADKAQGPPRTAAGPRGRTKQGKPHG